MMITELMTLYNALDDYRGYVKQIKNLYVEGKEHDPVDELILRMLRLYDNSVERVTRDDQWISYILGKVRKNIVSHLNETTHTPISLLSSEFAYMVEIQMAVTERARRIDLVEFQVVYASEGFKMQRTFLARIHHENKPEIEEYKKQLRWLGYEDINVVIL